MSMKPSASLQRQGIDWSSAMFTAVTATATALILLILVCILGNIVLNGLPNLSWRFVSTIPKENFFDANTTGVLAMIIGTTIRVLVMTLFVIPVGVIGWYWRAYQIDGLFQVFPSGPVSAARPASRKN